MDLELFTDVRQHAVLGSEAPITSWVFQNREALNFNVIQYNWPRYWWPGLFDIEAQITVDGVTFSGRGSAMEEKLAMEKAASEAIERATCHANKISSHGVAAHSDRKEALNNSVLEYYERLAIKLHETGGYRIKKASSNFLENSFYLNHVVKRLQLSSVELSYYFLLCPDQMVTSCVLAKYMDQTFTGHSTQYGTLESLESSLIEILRNFSAYFNNPFTEQQKHLIYPEDHKTVPCDLFSVKNKNLDLEKYEPISVELEKPTSLKKAPLYIFHSRENESNNK